MKRTSMVALAAALALVLALTVTACGGSDDDSGSSSSSSGAETGAATSEPAGEAIPIGFIGSIGGEHTSSYEYGIDAITAWVDNANATGGVNGHPLELHTVDDENDATKALQGAKELIEEEEVIALVGSYSTVDVAWEKYVGSKGVPVIGSAPLNAPYASNPDFFPQAGGFPVFAYALISAAQEQGVKKLGLAVCAESPTCALGGDLIRSIGDAVGTPGIQVYKIGTAAPNYNSTCTSAEQAGLEGIAFVTSTDSLLRMAGDCAQLGYEPAYFTMGLALDEEKWAEHPEMDGATVAVYAPIPVDGVPAREERNQVFEEAGIPTDDVLSSSIWSSAEIFKLAAERGEVEPTSTPDDVKKGLYTFKDETVGNLTESLTFTPDEPTFNECYWELTWENEEYQQVGSNEATCVPPQKLDSILKVLGG